MNLKKLSLFARENTSMHHTVPKARLVYVCLNTRITRIRLWHRIGHRISRPHDLVPPADHAAKVHCSHALSLPKNRARDDSETQLGFGYSRHSIEWTGTNSECSSRYWLLQAQVKSLRCSCSISESHLNSVTLGNRHDYVNSATLVTTSSSRAKKKLQEEVRFYSWNFTATKKLLDRWCFVRNTSVPPVPDASVKWETFLPNIVAKSL